MEHIKDYNTVIMTKFEDNGQRVCLFLIGLAIGALAVMINPNSFELVSKITEDVHKNELPTLKATTSNFDFPHITYEYRGIDYDMPTDTMTTIQLSSKQDDSSSSKEDFNPVKIDNHFIKFYCQSDSTIIESFIHEDIYKIESDSLLTKRIILFFCGGRKVSVDNVGIRDVRDVVIADNDSFFIPMNGNNHIINRDYIEKRTKPSVLKENSKQNRYQITLTNQEIHTMSRNYTRYYGYRVFNFELVQKKCDEPIENLSNSIAYQHN